ncbi:MAG: hypothetical protein R3C56_37990 [Pirellulaceae bacterium]
MAKKLFTYNVSVSFAMQFTFAESEVEQSDEGDEGDMSPTQAALAALGKELEECISQQFGEISNIEAWADFDELLGVMEE